MNALEFVIKTKELIPNKEKMQKKNLSKNFIDESILNFLTLNSVLVEEDDAIIWVAKNCNIKSFTVGYIYFIEPFVIDNFIIVAQVEADYIALNKISKEVYLVVYEEIDEYLYGDGEIPKFENKYLIAKNSESFLDILSEKLRLQKLLKENLNTELENRELITKSFTEKATELAGGINYEAWRIF